MIAPAAVRLKMSEKQLQDTVLQCAQTFKWRCYHTYDSRRSQAGFPDLVMARGSRLVFSELKSAIGVLKPEQADWGASLLLAGQEWYEWRPEDWLSGEIERILR